MGEGVKPKWKRTLRSGDWRVDAFRFGMAAFACVIAGRLFLLQIIDHSAYQALASGQHEIFQELFPDRGDILVRDLKDGTPVSVATNQELAFVFADPRKVKDAEKTAEAIGAVFGYDEAHVDVLRRRLDRPMDPYEPIEREVTDETLASIVALELPGILFVREAARLYPEGNMGGHLIGFLGYEEDGTQAGKYGVEGYFNAELTGSPGFLRSERDISGRLIAIGDRSIEPAMDGSDVVLTIDRTIQYVACSALQKAVAKHQADGGSVVILEPNTGKILAMCGAPDFDPSDYRDVPDFSVFNNPAIFKDYEPGSIFKSITIAAALDTGAVTPSTTYEDTGAVQIDEYTIKNSDLLSHGVQTMTEALEKSLNTGMIFAMRETGQETFTKYVKAFGFGERTGVELDTEMPGDVRPLDIGSEVYAATASFGQGITVTPLQMAAAYAAIANGGILKRTTIVEEIRHPDGRVETHPTEDVRRVVDAKTARLLGAMLVSVIEHGHGKLASVPGYYIAGKTGTAQVAKKGVVGYEEEETIGSFAGFGPVENPKFVMVVRIDHPRDVPWAESTAAPLFGEIAAFLLQYFEIPPTRNQ